MTSHSQPASTGALRVDNVIRDKTYKYISAPCGSGKTHFILNHIIDNGGKFILSNPKQSSCDERENEFYDILKEKGIDPKLWKVKVIHGGTPGLGSVSERIKTAIRDLTISRSSNCLLIICHEGHHRVRWQSQDEASNFTFIIDEAPEIATATTLKLNDKTKDFKDHFTTLTDPGNDLCYRLIPNEIGKRELSLDSGDFFGNWKETLADSNIENLLVYAEKENWDDVESKSIDVCTVRDLRALDSFKEVIVIGDDLEYSMFFKIGQRCFNIKWNRMTFAGQKREHPLSDRASVFYFSNWIASKNRFSRDDCLTSIMNYLLEEVVTDRKKFIWTVNSSYENKMKKQFTDTGYLQPKSHGINLLKDCDVVSWTCAMKSTNADIKPYSTFFGFTEDDLLHDRELNPLYQMVMRTNLRVYNSSRPVLAFVFDKQQAEYLGRRLGVTPVYIDGVVKEFSKQTKSTVRGGRPEGYRKENAMSPAERQRAYRERLKKKRSGDTSKK